MSGVPRLRWVSVARRCRQLVNLFASSGNGIGGGLAQFDKAAPAVGHRLKFGAARAGGEPAQATAAILARDGSSRTGACSNTVDPGVSTTF
jgi:hypothetical protein